MSRRKWDSQLRLLLSFSMTRDSWLLLLTLYKHSETLAYISLSSKPSLLGFTEPSKRRAGLKVPYLWASVSLTNSMLGIEFLCFGSLLCMKNFSKNSKRIWTLKSSLSSLEYGSIRFVFMKLFTNSYFLFLRKA